MKLTKIFLRIFVSFSILSSCKNELDKEEIAEKDNYVSEKAALSIAQNIMLKDEGVAGLLSSKKKIKYSEKKIKSTLTVPDKNNDAAYYIINYEKGGFVILSADKREQPILAFSEESDFSFDSEYYPSGLVGWLHSTKSKIEDIREHNLPATSIAEGEWNKLLGFGPPPDDPNDCSNKVIQKGPYVETTWGQGCDYNSLLDKIDNCSSLPCERPYTGCVATAMAQIMKYHEYPNRYNWSDMLNTEGTNSTALLMKDIGSAVDMNYRCNGSGASTETKVDRAFKNDFGYSSASYDNYNFHTVVNELKNKRPVVLKGGRKEKWWIFGQYADGHAWVSDGYKHYILCSGTEMYYLHMNWGWGISGFPSQNTYNGWYSKDNFNPGNNTFNYKRGMVYNIRP